MKELAFQSALIEAARRDGAHAFKLSHRTMAGVVDLYVKLPMFRGMFVEVKYMDRQTTPDKLREDGFRLDLTPLQKQFIHKERAAGGMAGWVWGAPCGQDTIICSGIFSEVKQYPAKMFTRQKGMSWPIIQILDQIVSLSNGR